MLLLLLRIFSKQRFLPLFIESYQTFDFKVIENDLVNCCQNGQDLVDYRNWGTGVEAVAAKTGKELFRFGGSVGRHMVDKNRAVPVKY